MSKQRRPRPINKCRRCGTTKKLPSTRQKGVDYNVYVYEPYCSRVCAEKAAGLKSRVGQKT